MYVSALCFPAVSMIAGWLEHTAETVCLWYLMDLLLENKEPLVFVGNAGDRKTAPVKDKLNGHGCKSGLQLRHCFLDAARWVDFRIILSSRNEEKGIFETHSGWVMQNDFKQWNWASHFNPNKKWMLEAF